MALACAFVACTACGGDDDGTTDVDAAGVDAATTGCATELVADTTFAVDPGGAGTQIHAAAVSDGRTVWVAYDRPAQDGSGLFDVYLVGLQCDGTQAFAPVLVNTANGRNDVDPAIARGDDGGLAIVWQSDNREGVDNLDIIYRVMEPTGTPRMATARILETTHGGDPVPGVTWMPSVAPQAGGGYAIAGSRALDDAGTFQVFVQRIDSAGELDGEAFDAAFEAGVTQTYPSLATGADDRLYLAWTRSPAANEDRVVHGVIAPGASAVEPTPPPFAASVGSDGADYHVAGNGTAYLALTLAQGEVDVVLIDGTTAPSGGQLVTLGAAGRVDHSPSVASGAPGTGAVVWYRTISGIRNEVVVQAFGYGGVSFALGPEQVIQTDEAAAPYRPAIAHVRDQTYFIAWSEGVSPDFVINGRFVDLAAAQP